MPNLLSENFLLFCSSSSPVCAIFTTSLALLNASGSRVLGFYGLSRLGKFKIINHCPLIVDESEAHHLPAHFNQHGAMGSIVTHLAASIISTKSYCPAPPNPLTKYQMPSLEIRS
jgi:hypothetical protein